MRRALLAGGAVCAAMAYPAPAAADTLREALLQTYRANPTLEAARAQQRALDEQVVLQKAEGRPQASADAQYIEFLRNSPNSFTAPERTLQIGPQLTVPIYSGGAVRNGIRAARERVDAGQADLRALESALFSQTVAAYMDVLEGEALVGLNRNQVEVLAVNLEATRDRFEIGDLTRTDIAQSQSRLALAESDLESARANLIQAREVYLQLVGEAPTDLAPPPPLPGLPDSAETATAIALENNPDLIAAAERAVAAGLDIDVARAGRLPRVSLFTGAQYTDFFGTLGGGLSSELVQSETTANAGVQATIPLYQGGRPAARVRQAQAEASAALERVVEVERDVIAQVRAAYASYRAANAIIASAQTAVAATELALEGVRAENTVGNRTVLDILDAEQEQLLARTQLVTARRNAYVAGFSLLAAMGRAEARDLGLADEGLLYDPELNLQRVEGRWSDWNDDGDPALRSTRTVDIPPADADIPGDAPRPEPFELPGQDVRRSGERGG